MEIRKAEEEWIGKSDSNLKRKKETKKRMTTKTKKEK